VTNWASNHAAANGDLAAAHELSRAARAAAVELGDNVVKAIALDGHATILFEQGDLDEAAKLFAEERELCQQQTTLDWLLCPVLYRLAAIGLEHGRLEVAEELAEQSLALLGEHGSVWMKLRALRVLSHIALERGDLETAANHLSQVHSWARSVGDARGTIDVLIDMARLEQVRGDARPGRQPLAEALRVGESTNDPLASIRVLESVVTLRAAARPEAVLRLAGAAAAQRSRLGARLLPLELERSRRALRLARGRLARLTADTAWTLGTVTDEQGAIALARELIGAGSAVWDPQAGEADSRALTAREREIAELISRGYTNRAISEALAISEGTVRAHIEHILGKLALRSRLEIAAALNP
jgi:non-specific serine/threonine protein kinase